MDHIKRRDAQLPYISDEAVFAQQKESRKRLQALNAADDADFATIARLSAQILGSSQGAVLTPPFHCDYGKHIHVGKNFFANFNCTILDVAPVTIGDNVLLAPNVAIYTAGHPVHPDTRRTGYEYGIEVTIGNDVWVGGNTVICPGVHIGDGCVIGAGSVVTKDIPPYTVAAGNPCRVIRPITEADRNKYYKDREFDAEAWADLLRIQQEQAAAE